MKPEKYLPPYLAVLIVAVLLSPFIAIGSALLELIIAPARWIVFMHNKWHKDEAEWVRIVKLRVKGEK